VDALVHGEVLVAQQVPPRHLCSVL
jgi:hypothetical protein